jgi:surface antigen
MLGFNDCISSCLYNNYSSKYYALKYSIFIDSLTAKYPQNKFYCCSVNPVLNDYPCAEYINNKIPTDILNESIINFNSELKKYFPEKYIDTYNYVLKTNCSLRDGVRYTTDTVNNLLNLIINNLSEISSGNFKPRFEEPDIDDEVGNEFWISTDNNGYNPFPKPSKYTKTNGDTLPNCTAYAWGRFYEILGTDPTLSKKNAEYWFLTDGKHGYGDDGYQRGQEPKEGAVICWQNGSIGGEAGHVAVVEQINPDGTIITSESGWEDALYWWTTKRDKNGYYYFDGDGNENYRNTGINSWGISSPYIFQGFIYNPKTLNVGVCDYVDKSNITANNTSLGANIINESFSNVNQISEEMKINARYIWNYLGSRQEENKWTLNAVAGMLGNMQAESTINPGRWQSGKEWKEPADRHGYGLVQWTPYTKFTNWCTEQYGKENRDEKMKDIDVALQRIEKEVEVDGGRWIAGLSQWQNKSAYNNMSFKSFTKSKESCEYLAEVFLYSYERPSKDGEVTAGRCRNAKFWYDYLLQYAPGCGKSFDVINFKTDFILPNEAQLSFLAGEAKTGNYTLYDANNNIKETNKKLDVVSTNDGLKLVVFKCTNLIPDSSYKIVLEIRGSSSEDLKKITLTFKTPQDYPKEVKAVKLSFEDEYVSSKSTFILDVKMPNYIGYWNKECGYELQLIINGDNKKSKIINNIEDIKNFKFNIKAYFGYECTTGDIVQINVKTWVKPNGKNKIYDLYNGKTSKAICLLNSQVRAFVNK